MRPRARAHGEVSSSGRKMKMRERKAWNEGLFYELQLNGPAPDRFYLTLDNPYKPTSGRVDHLVDLYHAFGQAVSTTQEARVSPWWTEAITCQFDFDRFHGFSWVSDLAASGENNREIAQALTESWLHHCGKYDPETWRPSLVCERLWQFSMHGNWLLKEGDALFRSRLLTSVARQTRHLAKAVARLDEPSERLSAAIMLCFMGLGLPYHETCEVQGSTLLRRELRLQLRADGGHISRNPSIQLKFTLLLQALLAAYRTKNKDVPNFLYHAVGRMTDMVDFFRSGDGRLAVFNGSVEDNPSALSKALSFDNIGRTRIDFASQSGYQRLSGARAFLFVDIGEARTSSHGQQGRYNTNSGYGSAFSLQFSQGRQRLVVNCGSVKALVDSGKKLNQSEFEEWYMALSGRDAHSGLCILEPYQSANPIAGNSRQEMLHHLQEDRSGQLIELENNDLADAPGCTHRRRLYLSIDGDDLRGEDVLVPPSAEKSPVWCLRFHLHPSIKVSLSRDARSAILLTPQHEGWTFEIDAGHIEIETSIYCASKIGVQKTRQLVVMPDRRQGAIREIKWSFKKST